MQIRNYVKQAFVAAILAATVLNPASANATAVDVNDLPAFLTKEQAYAGGHETLSASQLQRYPKLAAIVGVRNSSDTVTSKDLIDKLKRHVHAYASLFAALDEDHDGRVTLIEVARKAPKLMVYFPYIDLNADGSITFDELLSSRIVFRSGGNDQSHGKSARHGDSSAVADVARQLSSVARNDEQMPLPDDTSFNDFEAAETLRLQVFFANDRQKEEPFRVEPVEITGYNEYSSTSGFYATYGMWVTNENAFDASFPPVDAMTPSQKICVDAAFVSLQAALRSCGSAGHPTAIRLCTAFFNAWFAAQVAICMASG